MESSAFQNLSRSKKKGKAGIKEAEEGKALQARVKDALGRLDGKRVWLDRQTFMKSLDVALTAASAKISVPLRTAIVAALGERDESAEPCIDEDGAPEPDADLRDNENVPMKEDIHDYFDREVRPHVSDAWIDESKTTIGYEIPFTRHFYKCTPMRPLTEIEGDIRKLESEIQGMLGEVLA